MPLSSSGSLLSASRISPGLCSASRSFSLAQSSSSPTALNLPRLVFSFYSQNSSTSPILVDLARVLAVFSVCNYTRANTTHCGLDSQAVEFSLGDNYYGIFMIPIGCRVSSVECNSFCSSLWCTARCLAHPISHLLFLSWCVTTVVCNLLFAFT